MVLEAWGGVQRLGEPGGVGLEGCGRGGREGTGDDDGGGSVIEPVVGGYWDEVFFGDIEAGGGGEASVGNG